MCDTKENCEEKMAVLTPGGVGREEVRKKHVVYHLQPKHGHFGQNVKMVRQFQLDSTNQNVFERNGTS